MKRRDFLELFSLQALLLASGQRSMAQTFQNQTTWGHDDWEGFFVTVIFEGAWDISLSLDPWIKSKRPLESDYFLEYSPSDLINWGSSALGPAMKAMTPHLNDISVINGIMMSTNDNGHESLRDYALTGDVLNHRAALNLELDLTLPKSFFSVLTSNPIPIGERPNQTTNFNSALEALNSKSDFSSHTFIKNAKSGILQKVKEANVLESKLHSAQTLMNQYLSQMGSSSQDNEIGLMAAAFKTGLARTAVLAPVMNLDTHDNHPGRHLEEQAKGWASVNNLFNLFKSIEYKNGKSLFDMTTFMITSEFSRTPALNPARGKDHNPWANSALLAGRGIKGQVVQGGSQIIERNISAIGIPYLTGLHLNLEKNQVIEKRSEIGSGIPITPQNVIRTVSDAMGLNINLMGGNLKKISSLKQVLKT